MSDLTPAQVMPYKGLIPYTEEDAPFFFGREREQAVITANLMAARLTVLYGPTGAGKSSVLRAGVAHTLREYAQHALSESGEPELAIIVFNNWRDDPVAGLSRAVQATVQPILAALNPPGEAASPPPGLAPALEAWAKPFQGGLLIILDQFEEYFLYHAQDDGEHSFGVEFSQAVNRPDLRVNFLVALREDALSKLDYFKGRIPNLFGNYLRLAHLTRAAARDALTKPLDEYNRRLPPDAVEDGTSPAGDPARGKPVTIEPALVEAVLTQVQTGRVTLARDPSGGGEGLPSPTDATIETAYLQLVMERLWNEEMRAGSRTLRLETLTRLEGAEHIVRTHLDTVMQSLEPAERDLAAEVFRYLVTPSGTKIAYPATDLAAYAQTPGSQLTPVLERLAGSGLRILRTVEPPPGQPQETRYEIFHDVLASAVLDWRARYAQTKEQAAEQRRRALLEAQRQKELDDARRLAESETRRANQLRTLSRITGVVGVVALVAAIAAGFLGIQSNRNANSARMAEANARQQSLLAFSRQLAAQAVSHLDNGLDLALLLGIEAYRVDPTVEARNILLTGLQYSPYLRTFLRGHTSGVLSVAFSPDSKMLASAGGDQIILWDLSNPESPVSLGAPLTVHTDSVLSVAFSPDGKTLASADGDQIILWDVSNPQSPAPLGAPLTGQTYGVWSVAFSPDGKTLASRNGADTILLWDLSHPKSPTRLAVPLTGHTDDVLSVALSPDGKTLASGSFDQTIILWDVSNPQSPIQLSAPLTGYLYGVSSVAFSPDGKTLASADADQSTLLWDVSNPQSPVPFGAPLTGNLSTFSPDSKMLASAGGDQIILWDLSDPESPVQLSAPLTGHTSGVLSVAFSPDGKTLASGSDDQTIILWDLSDPESPVRLAASLTGHTSGVLSVAFSPLDGGKTLASGGCGQTDTNRFCKQGEILLWDVSNPQSPVPLGAPLTGHTSWVSSVAFSPLDGGKTLASGSYDQTILLWDLSNPRSPVQLGAPLTGHTSYVLSVAFSPDGKTLASGGCGQTDTNGFCKQGEIFLWDVSNPQSPVPLGVPLTGHTDWVSSVAFSPLDGGKTLASGSYDQTILLWDLSNPRSPVQLGAPLIGHTDRVWSVAFSPDGKTLASGGLDDTIILWDLSNPTSPVPLSAPLTGQTYGVSSVAFSPDGKTLASSGRDDTIILWDLSNPTSPVPLSAPLTRHTNWVGSVAFSPDGKTLASGSDDRTIILLDVDVESWKARACNIVARNLTRAEWVQYWGDQPYHKTCEAWPEGK